MGVEVTVGMRNLRTCLQIRVVPGNSIKKMGRTVASSDGVLLVCSGLENLHRIGVLHCSDKPETSRIRPQNLNASTAWKAPTLHLRPVDLISA